MNSLLCQQRKALGVDTTHDPCCERGPGALSSRPVDLRWELEERRCLGVWRCRRGIAQVLKGDFMLAKQ
jgi:hypothetical protein